MVLPLPLSPTMAVILGSGPPTSREMPPTARFSGLSDAAAENDRHVLRLKERRHRTAPGMTGCHSQMPE